MAGPKFKPTALKLLRTTARKAQRLIAKQTVAPGPLVEPPDWFDDEQKTDWKYAIENAPRDVLKKADKGVLAGYIVAQSLHKRAALAHASSKMLIKSPHGMPMQNPYLPIVNTQYRLMLRAASELGFTPCSRARIDAGRPPAPMADDDWADIATG